MNLKAKSVVIQKRRNLELDEERAGSSQVGQEKVWQRSVATNVSQISRVPHLCGCALYDVFLELGGSESSSNEVLQHLLVLIKHAGKALTFSLPAGNKLSMSMIRTIGGPKIKTKASEGRTLLASLKYVFQHTVSKNLTSG